ncbi:hypothetical protein E4T42_05047 [Aureobasidium subglaciale]|nr:hypothetical protein E4T38_03521 [Aureobasidium subglaciale]KAI5225713.1 hypothetical protein E4T40_03296 [Aureobasidium subglaciale]KAI5229179.1 hypothetical protein E4T41_03640 [Aureobasidium subglaciale]KAI5250100.1 hypothetical protein E4T42_05047 [Aureobasidium subglaciale]KAI5263973.1 hypothetical protein E4T46_03295 [Aureobasidium subglaciale]
MVPLKVETWIWWSFVVLISRYQSLGTIKRFQADDYITVVAMCFYTTLIVTINIVAKSDSNLLPPGFDVSSLTSQEVHDREYGSKLVLVVEQCQIITVWCEKLCLLFLYQRLTVGTKERLAIKILFFYVGISWVVMEILYFGVWCRPFTMYWAVPSTQQCTAATNHLILNAVFNLSSDICILAVALPMFIKTRLPLRKKVAIVGIFSLGTFVIICAILNKVYSWREPYGVQWTYWYVRESSTALLTANAAFVWALFRRMFKLRSLGSFSGKNTYTPYNGYTPTYTTTHTRVETLVRKKPRHDEIDLDLLMPDPDDFEGIHRQTDIHVSEDTMSLKRENNSMTGTSSAWAEAWAVRAPAGPPPGSSSSREGNSSDCGRSTSDSTTSIVPTPQKPSKAILRQSQNDSPV